MSRPFAHALCDAIFTYDKEDIARINVWGAQQTPQKDFKTLCETSSAWVNSHCKRIIGPPQVLYPAVQEVFERFGPLKDSKTGAALFNTQELWDTAKNVLKLIHDGYILDLPHIVQ